MNDSILSKRNSLILRALGILSILMHNWYHSGFSISRENEMNFYPQRIEQYLSAIFSGNSLVVESSAFIGWTGVAVFVFLTGYGSAISPAPVNANSCLKYVRRNWMKLFLLLLPLIIVYTLIDVVNASLSVETAMRFIYLTFLNNFIYPYFVCHPHINWYFGLTFQLYLLWALFGRFYKKDFTILLWGVIFLVGLYLCILLGNKDIISIYRHCFTGWFVLFAIGVFMAVHPNIVSRFANIHFGVEICLAVFSPLLMVLSNYYLETWLFLPILALFWFMILGNLILKTKILANMMIWIGKLSACLFVCYPLSRWVVKSSCVPFIHSVELTAFIYLCLNIVMAYCYNLLYQKLLIFFKVKRDRNNGLNSSMQ